MAKKNWRFVEIMKAFYIPRTVSTTFPWLTVRGTVAAIFLEYKSAQRSARSVSPRLARITIDEFEQR